MNLDLESLLEIGLWGLGAIASFYASNKYMKKAEQTYLRTRAATYPDRYTNSVDDIMAAVEPSFLSNLAYPDRQSETEQHKSPEKEYSLPKRILGGEYFSFSRSPNAPPIPRSLNTFQIKKLGMKLLNNSVVFEVMIMGKLHTNTPYEITPTHPTIATVTYGVTQKAATTKQSKLGKSRLTTTTEHLYYDGLRSLWLGSNTPGKRIAVIGVSRDQVDALFQVDAVKQRQLVKSELLIEAPHKDLPFRDKAVHYLQSALGLMLDSVQVLSQQLTSNWSIDATYSTIKVGTPVCMLCDLVYDRNTRQVTLNNVRYIAKDFTGLAQKYSTKDILVGGISIAALALGLYCGYNLLRRTGEALAAAEVNPRGRRVGGIGRAVTGFFVGPNQEYKMKGHKCDVCKVNLKGVINLPCRHIISCKDCHERLGGSPRCSECNQRVINTSEFYFT